MENQQELDNPIPHNSYYRGGPLVTLTNEVMEIFVLTLFERLESEIVNDQQWHPDQRLHLAFDVTSGSGGMDLRQQVRLRGEHHIDTLAHGAVSNGLSQMTLPSTTRSSDQ